MKTDRLPLLILALADIAGLVYAVYGFARAGAFVLTFLAERVSEAAASFSFDDFGLSILFLITPLSSLLLYCLLPVSAYGLARGRTWVRWVVPAQLPSPNGLPPRCPNLGRPMRYLLCWHWSKRGKPYGCFTLYGGRNDFFRRPHPVEAV